MTTKTRAKKAAPNNDVETVKQSAAAPHASRAGTEEVLSVPGVPLTITLIDGARAKLDLADHDPLSQAELQAIGKLIDQAVQGTY